MGVLLFTISLLLMLSLKLLKSSRQLCRADRNIEEAIFLLNDGGYLEQQATEILLGIVDRRRQWMLVSLMHEDLTLSQHLERMVESRDASLSKFVITVVKPKVSLFASKLK